MKKIITILGLLVIALHGFSQQDIRRNNLTAREVLQTDSLLKLKDIANLPSLTALYSTLVSYEDSAWFLDQNGVLHNLISDNTLTVNWDSVMTACLGSDEHSLKNWFDLTQSSGKMHGGTFIDIGTGELSVGSGFGVIRAVDSDTAQATYFHWDADTLTLVNNSVNYIYLDYNSGTPILGSETTAIYRWNDGFYLGKVYREGTTLHLLDAGMVLNDHAGRVLRRFVMVNGEFQRATGMITSEVGTRNIATTAGVGFAGLTKIATTAENTSTGDSFEYYYQDGGGGWTEVAAQTQIDNTYYDDGSGTLDALTSNRYGVHWVYVCNDSDILVVYGQGDYTLSNAEAAQPPATLPGHVSGFSTLSAKIIIQKGDATFYSVGSAFDISFNPSLVTDHNDLASIQGGVADEYYHLIADDYGYLTDANAQLEDLQTDGNPSFNSLYLPVTSDTTDGVIFKDSSRFIHDYEGGSGGGDGRNLFFGKNAGTFNAAFNSSGAAYEASYNLSMGENALSSLTTGWANTAIGWESMKAVTSAHENTAIGRGTLQSLTTGRLNFALGKDALYSLVDGYMNNAFGHNAGFELINGYWNVFVGEDAGYENLHGTSNVFLGRRAGFNSTGSQNVFIGDGVGDDQTSGDGNIAIGYNLQLPSLATSNQLNIGNVIKINYMALSPFVHAYSGALSSGGNTFIGYFAGNETMNASSVPVSHEGSKNTGMGYNALNDLTSGYGNTAMGNQALRLMQAGYNNVAMGQDALYTATGGWANMAIGRNALFSLVDGNNNVAVGKDAGWGTTTGDQNIFIGTDAGQATTTGTYQIIIGHAVEADTADDDYYINLGNLYLGDWTPSTMIANINGSLMIDSAYTFPVVDGANGEVLTTNGSGVVSWGAGGSFTLPIDSLRISSALPQLVWEETDQADSSKRWRMVPAGGDFYFETQTDLAVKIENVWTVNATKGIVDNLTFNNGDVKVSDNFYLAAAGASTTGVVYAGSSSFLHSYGTSNLFLGITAGNFTAPSSAYNIGIGTNALNDITTGDNNVAIGYLAMEKATTPSNIVAIGYKALSSITTASYNMAVGYQALMTNTTGNHNTAIGLSALEENDEGEYNTAVGYEAMQHIEHGDANTGIGYSVLKYYATPMQSTAVGFAAGEYSGGSFNVFMGYHAGFGYDAGRTNTTSQNVFVGWQAGDEQLTGGSNVFVGYNSGVIANTGVGNTLLGWSTGSTLTTGGYNILLGYNIEPDVVTGSYQINIGDLYKGSWTGNKLATIAGRAIIDSIGNATGDFLTAPRDGGLITMRTAAEVLVDIGAISSATADATYLKLDCSNDPLVNSLSLEKIGAISLTLNTKSSGSDAAIYLTEGTTTTEYGAMLTYDGSTNKFHIKTGTTTLTERITILRDSGFVGILTPSPNTELEVIGDIRATDSSSRSITLNTGGSNQIIETTGGLNLTAGSGVSRFTNYGTTSELQVDDAAQVNKIVLRATGNSLFNGGYVGVNVATVYYPLHVYSATENVTIGIEQGSSSYDAVLRLKTPAQYWDISNDGFNDSLTFSRDGVQKVLISNSGITTTDPLTIGTIANSTGDFLTAPRDGGLVTMRTAAEVLVDIGAISSATADATYLKLDCSNDPLIADLAITGSGIDNEFALHLTNTGSGDGLRITTADATGNNGIYWNQGSTSMFNLYSHSSNNVRLAIGSTIFLSTNGASYFNGGFVGIGYTTNPGSYKFAVDGTGYFSGDLTVASGSILIDLGEQYQIKRSDGVAVGVMEVDANDDLYIGSTSLDKVFIRDDAGIAITLDGSSNATFAGDVSIADGKKIRLGDGYDLDIWSRGDTTQMDIGHILKFETKAGDIPLFTVAQDSVYSHVPFKIGDYAFPIADGTANQVLATDGSGTLSWDDQAGTDLLPLNNDWAGINEYTDTVKIEKFLRIGLEGHSGVIQPEGRYSSTGTHLTVQAGENFVVGVGGLLYLAGGNGVTGDGDVYLGYNSGGEVGDVFVKTQTALTNNTTVASTNYVDLAVAAGGGGGGGYWDRSAGGVLTTSTANDIVEINDTLVIEHTAAYIRFSDTDYFTDNLIGTNNNTGTLTIRADLLDVRADSKVSIGVDNEIQFKVTEDGIEIGADEAGVDYSIVFRGQSDDGTIWYMEDEDRLDFNMELALLATDKLYFDGGTETYIVETSDDQLDFAVGGHSGITINEEIADTVNVKTNSAFTTNTHIITTLDLETAGYFVEADDHTIFVNVSTLGSSNVNIRTTSTVAQEWDGRVITIKDVTGNCGSSSGDYIVFNPTGSTITVDGSWGAYLHSAYASMTLQYSATTGDWHIIGSFGSVTLY